MKAVISSDFNPIYLFFIPIAAFSWNKLGVDTICFMPYLESGAENAYIDLVIDGYHAAGANVELKGFGAPAEKKATYAQVSRLMIGCNDMKAPDDEIFIISDVDMAVFSKDLVNVEGSIHVWGNDLTELGQIPMCYLSASKANWNKIMRCEDRSVQQMLDYHLGSIEAENFRGNFFCRDQELAWSHILPHEHTNHPRAYPGTQFATRREDRDSWGNVSRVGLLDSHLPRPGYTEENFAKILDLFHQMYPGEDLNWMINYKNKFLKLLDKYHGKI